MSAYDEINLVSIISVLDKLAIKYSRSGGTLIIRDGDNKTNGRKANVAGNYVHNFSGKDRSIGGPFAVVKKYLSLTSRETFKRFEQNFAISYSDREGGSHFTKKNKALSIPYSRKRLSR